MTDDGNSDTRPPTPIHSQISFIPDYPIDIRNPCFGVRLADLDEPSQCIRGTNMKRLMKSALGCFACAEVAGQGSENTRGSWGSYSPASFPIVDRWPDDHDIDGPVSVPEIGRKMAQECIGAFQAKGVFIDGRREKSRPSVAPGSVPAGG